MSYFSGGILTVLDKEQNEYGLYALADFKYGDDATHKVRVETLNGEMALIVDGTIQSMYNKHDIAHPSAPYLEYLITLLGERRGIHSAHMLTLGSGFCVLERALLERGVASTIMTVENQEIMLSLALDYADLETYQDDHPELNYILGSLEDVPDNEEFDVVIGDCFQGSKLDSNIVNIEAFTKISRLLKSDGSYFINVVGGSKQLRLIDEAAKEAGVFSGMRLFTVYDEQIDGASLDEIDADFKDDNILVELFK